MEISAGGNRLSKAPVLAQDNWLLGEKVNILAFQHGVPVRSIMKIGPTWYRKGPLSIVIFLRAKLGQFESRLSKQIDKGGG